MERVKGDNIEEIWLNLAAFRKQDTCEAGNWLIQICVLEKSISAINLEGEGEVSQQLQENWLVGSSNSLTGWGNGSMERKNFLEVGNMDGMCGCDYEGMESRMDFKYKIWATCGMCTKTWPGGIWVWGSEFQQNILG